MRKTTVLLTVFGLGMAFLMAASGPVPAQSDTSGKVTLESKSVALGVGVSSGDGVLEYRGKKHSFTVEGLSVLDLGVAKVHARGEVKGLKKNTHMTVRIAGGQPVVGASHRSQGDATARAEGGAA